MIASLPTSVGMHVNSTSPVAESIHSKGSQLPADMVIVTRLAVCGFGTVCKINWWSSRHLRAMVSIRGLTRIRTSSWIRFVPVAGAVIAV